MTKENKEKKISKVPYHPLPYRSGNKVLRTYQEPFQDSMGNKAIVTKCDFVDKKGELTEGYDLFIKWLEEDLEFIGDNKGKFLEAFHSPRKELYTSYYDGYLTYFFEFKGDNYLAYNWDGDFLFTTFMAFKLKKEVKLTTDDEDNLFNCTRFEDIMNKMVDENYIEKIIAVKYLKYDKDIKVIEGNKAVIQFNKYYKKYCFRTIPLIK